jgi:SpoVK/Ycf46/Vps4 family AAA+-type ATPase
VRPSYKESIEATDIIPVDDNQMPIINDEDWCMFESEIPGYSLSAKRWCFFEVDRIEEFEYDTQAYDSLALEESQKAMLISLVKAHSDGLDFDDIVKGKGKGIIFLLHGVPGTGKTLTAGMLSQAEPHVLMAADSCSESLSDYTERPLFAVSSGDLGTTAPECEKALVDILDLATCWKALLLIDEADVFLEERSHHDLARNGVVSGKQISLTNVLKPE